MDVGEVGGWGGTRGGRRRGGRVGAVEDMAEGFIEMSEEAAVWEAGGC